MTTSGLPRWSWAGTAPALLPAAEQTLLHAWRPGGNALAEPPQMKATAQALARIGNPLADLGLHLGVAEDPAVTFREARFLSACAMVQRGQVLPGQAVLLSLLPCRPAQASFHLALSLGQQLKDAGLLLRNPWAGRRGAKGCRMR
ncbi:MAG: hypothetical protein ACR2IG_07950 [Roseomonas sp.]